jgi:hypothetical protein
MSQIAEKISSRASIAARGTRRTGWTARVDPRLSNAEALLRPRSVMPAERDWAVDSLVDFAADALGTRTPEERRRALADEEFHSAERLREERRATLDALCDFALDAIGCHDPEARARVLDYEEPSYEAPGSVAREDD